MGKLGKKVVSERLTVIDDPTLVRGLASRPFDGEGLAARRLTMIDQGATQNLYVDTYYGKKGGMPSCVLKTFLILKTLTLAS